MMIEPDHLSNREKTHKRWICSFRNQVIEEAIANRLYKRGALMFWIWIEIKSNKKERRGFSILILIPHGMYPKLSYKWPDQYFRHHQDHHSGWSSTSSFWWSRFFKPIMTRLNEPDEEEFHQSIIIILIWKDLYTGLDFISRQLSEAHCCGLFVIFLPEYWCINHRNLSSSGADQSVVLLPAASQREKKKSCARVKETSTDDVRPLLGELIFCGGFMTLSIIIEEGYNHEITYPKPPTPTY